MNIAFFRGSSAFQVEKQLQQVKESGDASLRAREVRRMHQWSGSCAGHHERGIPWELIVTEELLMSCLWKFVMCYITTC